MDNRLHYVLTPHNCNNWCFLSFVGVYAAAVHVVAAVDVHVGGFVTAVLHGVSLEIVETDYQSEAGSIEVDL